MAVTQSSTQSNGVVNRYVARYLEDDTAAAFTLDVGFTPRSVRVINLTSRHEMEWFEGMDDASALKTVAAGTRTLITSNGITVSGTNVTVGLDTDVVVADEQLQIIAEA